MTRPMVSQRISTRVVDRQRIRPPTQPDHQHMMLPFSWRGMSGSVAALVGQATTAAVIGNFFRATAGPTASRRGSTGFRIAPATGYNGQAHCRGDPGVKVISHPVPLRLQKMS